MHLLTELIVHRRATIVLTEKSQVILFSIEQFISFSSWIIMQSLCDTIVEYKLYGFEWLEAIKL
jgi:hypothetical protein